MVAAAIGGQRPSEASSCEDHRHWGGRAGWGHGAAEVRQELGKQHWMASRPSEGKGDDTLKRESLGMSGLSQGKEREHDEEKHGPGVKPLSAALRGKTLLRGLQDWICLAEQKE